MPTPSLLFGPVPSRRYGRSLGIDLVPMKTCCYDCLFCQLGPTPQTTCTRRDYVPLSDTYRQLEASPAKADPVHSLPHCAPGEPTPHPHSTSLGKIPGLKLKDRAMYSPSLLSKPRPP